MHLPPSTSTMVLLLTFLLSNLLNPPKGTGVVANHSEEDVSTGQQGNDSKKRESVFIFFVLLLHCFLFERKNFHQEVLNHDGVGCSTAKEVINNM